MEYLQSIISNIEANKEQMIKTLQELVQIKSVAEEMEGQYPFGEGVEQAFSYMLEKGTSEGFAVKDADHYGGHIDLP